MKVKLASVMIVSLLLGLVLISLPMVYSDDLIPETWVKGTVTDAHTGDPIERIWIDIYGPYGLYEHVETDENGYYECQLKIGGHYDLLTFSSNHEHGSASEDIDVGETAVIDFELIPFYWNCTVHGTVFDTETGDPVSAGISFYNLETGRNLGFHTETGEYQVELSGGYYRVECYGGPQYLPEERMIIQLEDGEERQLDFEIVRYPQGVKGVVKNENGQPEPDVVVSIESDVWRVSGRTDEEGMYEIRAPEGEYELSCNIEDFRPYKANIAFEENEIITYDVDLEEAKVLNFITQLIRMIMNMIGIM